MHKVAQQLLGVAHVISHVVAWIAKDLIVRARLSMKGLLHTHLKITKLNKLLKSPSKKKKNWFPKHPKCKTTVFIILWVLLFSHFDNISNIHWIKNNCWEVENAMWNNLDSKTQIHLIFLSSLYMLHTQLFFNFIRNMIISFSCVLSFLFLC